MNPHPLSKEREAQLVRGLIDLATECYDREEVLSYLPEVAAEFDRGLPPVIARFDALAAEGRIRYRKEKP